MAKLSVEEIKHIAKLANLKLSPEEIKKYRSQLSQVIDYVGDLSKADTVKIEPTSQTTGLINVFRVDSMDISETLSQENALSGTENTHNGYFKVKAVFAGKEDK